jgi:hypothetical protein
VLDQKVVPTNIILLMNTAWERSFAQVASSQKAIFEQGWSPSTYALLKHPSLVLLKE